MPPDEDKTADKLKAQVLRQIRDRHVAAQRTKIAQLTTELGIIRSALPNPSELYAAANVIDVLVPDDPEPEIQEGLRLYSEHIAQVLSSSGVGKECWAVIAVAALYAESVADYQAAMAEPETDQDALEALEIKQQDLLRELLETVGAVRYLLPPKLEPPKQEPEGDEQTRN